MACQQRSPYAFSRAGNRAHSERPVCRSWVSITLLPWSSFATPRDRLRRVRIVEAIPPAHEPSTSEHAILGSRRSQSLAFPEMDYITASTTGAVAVCTHCACTLVLGMIGRMSIAGCFRTHDDPHAVGSRCLLLHVREVYYCCLEGVLPYHRAGVVLPQHTRRRVEYAAICAGCITRDDGEAGS